MKKKYLSVTDLCSYKFCPRSLYIKLVLGLKVPLKPVMVFGSIRHKVFEDANKGEKELVERIDESTNRSQIKRLFSGSYNKILEISVKKFSSQLDSLHIEEKEVVESLKPSVKAQSEERAGQISDFSSKHRVFGEKLWKKLSPKVLSEIRIFSPSLKLRGVVDRIHVHSGEYVPVEIKTGRVPFDGVWPDHMLQLSAYMMLVNEKFEVKVSRGMVNYVKENAFREVYHNPFMDHEVISTRDRVFEMMESDIPKVCGRPCCEVCSYGDDFDRHLVRRSFSKRFSPGAGGRVSF